MAFEGAVDRLYEAYGHLHWVHVLNNAALVTLALAMGRGDFAESICLVVSGGWDTDSNGATAGSITGTLRGTPDEWTKPLKNRLASSMPGFDGIGFDELADRTLAVAAVTR
jgi:ADP-ribosylglycohydrolase